MKSATRRILTALALLGSTGLATPIQADERCCEILARCLLTDCIRNVTFETAEWISEHYLEDC
jgi:hypothetical protein